MAKYDCTKAKDFLHELKRASERCRKRSVSECKECEMVCSISLVRNLDCIPERQFDYVIQRLQNWSDNHPEKRKLTEDETNILKAFKILGFTYIATDSIGCVCSYVNKPRKGERAWFAPPGDCGTTAVCETKKFFGGIVFWEDEEPAKIEDLLKEVEQK